MEFSHAISPHGESFIGHNLYYNTDRQVLQGDMRKKIVLREKKRVFLRRGVDCVAARPYTNWGVTIQTMFQIGV
jgi:hypothetical protein